MPLTKKVKQILSLHYKFIEPSFFRSETELLCYISNIFKSNVNSHGNVYKKKEILFNAATQEAFSFN